MEFNVEKAKDKAIELAIGTGAAIVSLHVIRRTPEQYKKYTGWVLLGAGIIGLMVGGKMVQKASLIAASVGAVNAINSIAMENGVPAISGWKGMVNKVVPQLNGADGVPMLGFGSVEEMNETLLGNETVTQNLLGDGSDMLDEISGLGNATEKLLAGSLM
jgi:hypothetical protein